MKTKRGPAADTKTWCPWCGEIRGEREAMGVHLLSKHLSDITDVGLSRTLRSMGWPEEAPQ